MHFRILEWPGHEECWIEYASHFIDTPDGVKSLTCGGEECFTCAHLAELTEDGGQEATDIVKRSRRQLKVLMQIVDMDHPDKGPLLWEPKNTQSCSQWNMILAYFGNPDYFKDTYLFAKGRLFSMQLTSQKKKFGGKVNEVLTLKSLMAGTSDKPIRYGKAKDGSAVIQLVLKDGSKKVFPFQDIGTIVSPYKEEQHQEAWGLGADVGDGATFDDEGEIGGDAAGVTADDLLSSDGVDTPLDTGDDEGIVGGDDEGGSGDDEEFQLETPPPKPAGKPKPKPPQRKK